VKACYYIQTMSLKKIEIQQNFIRSNQVSFFIWTCFLSMSGTSWLLEQPSSCRMAYCYTILKARIMTMGSSAPWVVYIVSTYRLIVYRVVTKLLLHDSKTTLVTELLSLPYLASALPSLYEIEVLRWLLAMSNSMAKFSYVSPKWPQTSEVRDRNWQWFIITANSQSGTGLG
jgi:hypothetical protein